MTENTPIQLTLTVQAVQHVLNVLAQRPYAEVAGLIQEIGGQLSTATTPAAPD